MRWLLAFLLWASVAHAEVLTTWSGYQFTPGVPVTSMGGTWRTPMVWPATGSSGAQAVSVWIGITENQPGGDLIQTGGSQTISPPTISFAAAQDFYTYCPPCTSLGFSNEANPGDILAATITCTAACTTPGPQTWTLSLSDCGSWYSFRPPCVVGAAGNLWNDTATGVSYASSLLYATWIVECTPCGSGQFPNFGTVVWMSATTNGSAVNLNGSGVTPLQMLTTSGHFTANPSAPAVDGTDFSVCWGVSSTYTACPAPSTFAPASGARAFGP